MAINLGDINFGLGADTRRLDSARQAILDFGNAVNAAAAAQGKGARQAEAAMRRQEKAIVDALQSTLKMNDAIRKAGQDNTAINRTTTSLNRLVGELTKGRVSALQFQRSMEDFQTSSSRAARSLAAFNLQQQEAKKSAQAAAQAAKSEESYMVRLTAALFKAQQATDALNASAARTRAPTSTTASANTGLANLRSVLGNGSTKLSNTDFQKAQQDFQASLNRSRKSLADFKKAQADASTSVLESGLRRLADVSVLLSGPMSGIATRLTLISSVASSTSLAVAGLVTGIAAGAAAFIALGKSAIDADKIFYKASNALDGLTGSSTITAKELQYVMDTANRAGASFATVSEQYIRLTAAAKGTNLEGEATRKIFENILFASAKLGSSQDELGGSLRAVEQIISKGRVSAEELRGQLGDRLPGAIQIMAQALGVGTDKLDKMMRSGEITAAALVKFSETATKRLGVDTTQAIDSVVAAEARWGNAQLSFNKALNDSVGFSNAYKLALNTLATVVNSLAANMDTILASFGAVAGAIVGALAAIYAPTIISGFATLTNAIKAVTVSMLALNVASMANPFGALLGVILRVGAAAVGAVAGFELLGGAIGDTGNKLTQAKGVKEYIAAQSDLKTSIRATTEEFIKQQEVFSQAIANQITQLEGLAKSEQQRADSLAAIQDTARGIAGGGGLGMLADAETAGQINLATQRVEAYRAEIERLQGTAKDASSDLQKLRDILTRQSVEEKKREASRGNGLGAGTSSGSNRTELAIKNAKDTIRETQQALENLYLPKGQQEWANIQLDINKKVENFRDQLTKAKVPAEEVVALTKQYGDALRGLEEGSYALKHTVTAFDILAETLGKGISDAMDNLVDGVMEGKDAFEILRDTVKSVTADILKTLLQFAVSNPLKNLLFGTNLSTLSGVSNSNSGGLFSSLLSSLTSIFTGGSGVAASSTTIRHTGGMVAGGGVKRIVSPLAFANAPRFHQGSGGPIGLRAGERAIIAKDNEWISTARQMQQSRSDKKRAGSNAKGSNGNLYVSIQNNNNSNVQTHQRTNSDGQRELVIMINGMLASGQLDQGMARFSSPQKVR